MLRVALRCVVWSRKGGEGRVLVLAACLFCLSGFADAPDLSRFLEEDDTVGRLEKGALVVFKNVRFAEVSGEDGAEDRPGTLVLFLVSRPPDTAWAVLHDFDAHHTFMPNMAESELDSKEGDVYYVRYHYDILWTESTTYLWGTSDRDTMTLVWRFDPDRSDKRLKGLYLFWRVQKYGDGRALMAFFQHIEHTSMVNALSQKLLMSPRSTAKAVRKRVESEGTDGR